MKNAHAKLLEDSSKLMKEIDTVLEGHPLTMCIPALGCLLAQCTAKANIPISLVIGALTNTYASELLRQTESQDDDDDVTQKSPRPTKRWRKVVTT